MLFVVVFAVGSPVQEDVVAFAHGHQRDGRRLRADRVDDRLRDLRPVFPAQNDRLTKLHFHSKILIPFWRF
jgi:hypothetical protein